MGTSNWQNISYCCDLIFRIAPQRSLDIGIGSLGRWGMLLREFTDVWNGNVLREKWTRQIEGIEAFPAQLSDVQRTIYSAIHVGDAFEVIDRLGRYDLVVLGDVIEHFEEPRATQMLEKCLQHSDRVMVTTPLGTLEDWPQGEEYGNQWEKHRAMFTCEQFLDSERWRVVEHRLFRDISNRQFGTFLLQTKRS